MSISAYDPADLGREITGPTALGHDWRRFARLTWTLAITQFRLKFYGSALGYVWQLMRPLLLFGVLFVVFTEFVRLGDDVQYYPVVLLTGIVLYTFINEAVAGSVGSLVEREALLRKIDFPRMAVTCAVIVTALMNLGLNLIAIAIFSAIVGVDLHASILETPIYIAFLAALALGIGLLAAATFVRYRDVQPISDVFLQAFFYGSPVIFPLEIVPAAWREWLMLNPFAVVIQQVRHTAIDPSVPTAWEVGGWRCLVAVGIVVALLVIGFVVFKRRAPYVAEDL